MVEVHKSLSPPDFARFQVDIAATATIHPKAPANTRAALVFGLLKAHHVRGAAAQDQPLACLRTAAGAAPPAKLPVPFAAEARPISDGLRPCSRDALNTFGGIGSAVRRAARLSLNHSCRIRLRLAFRSSGLLRPQKEGDVLHRNLGGVRICVVIWGANFEAV